MKTKVKTKTAATVSIIIFLGSLAFSLAQIEKVDEINYLSKKYVSEISKISAKNEQLKDDYFKEIAKLDIKGKAKEIGFIKIDKIKYVPVANDYLAERGY